MTRWQAKLGEATRRGFRVVLSAPFYLDLLNLKHQAKGSDLYNGWQIMYHTEFDSTTYPMRTLKEPVQVRAPGVGRRRDEKGDVGFRVQGV